MTESAATMPQIPMSSPAAEAHAAASPINLVGANRTPFPIVRGERDLARITRLGAGGRR